MNRNFNTSRSGGSPAKAASHPVDSRHDRGAKLSAATEKVSTKEEIILHGIPASPGIAIGKVVVLKKDGVIIQERGIDNSSVELERLKKSIDRSSVESR